MTSSEKVQGQMLADPDTCGSVLLIIALNKYKDRVFEIDPMTLILELEEDFRIKMPEDNENKLKAILLATETGIIQHDSEAFRSVCITLWNGDPQLEFSEPLTLAEAIWGMFEVKTCHGELTLGPQVQHMLAQLSDHEIQSPEEHEDPYGHVKEGVQERYRVWREQMVRAGVDVKDLPVLEGE